MEENKPRKQEIRNDPKFCILILQMVCTALLLLGMFGLRLSGGKLYKNVRTLYYQMANDSTSVKQVLEEEQTESDSDSVSSESDIQSEPPLMQESEILNEDAESDGTVSESMAENVVFDFKTVQTMQNTAVSKTHTMIWPLKTYTKTSDYGYRKDPFTGKKAFHHGVDLAADKGSPIAAVLDGTVTAVGEGKSYGNYILVRHNSNMSTLYAHCSKIVAKKGQSVKQGDTIALVGSTGRSTGNHLHFEIRIGGERINPLWLLP